MTVWTNPATEPAIIGWQGLKTKKEPDPPKIAPAIGACMISLMMMDPLMRQEKAQDVKVDEAIESMMQRGVMYVLNELIPCWALISRERIGKKRKIMIDPRIALDELYWLAVFL